MAALLRGWHVIGPPLALIGYGVFLYAVLVAVALAPAQALALSATGYERVLAQANRIADIAFRKAAMAETVGAAAAAASPVSTALRVIAGPLGWAALGVSAGLVLYDVYYSQQKLQDVKQVVGAQEGDWQIPGYTHPITQAGAVTSTCTSPCNPNWAPYYDQWAYVQADLNKPCDIGQNPGLVPSGWIFGGWVSCGNPPVTLIQHSTGAGNLATQTSVAPTAQQITNYIINPAGV